MKIVYASDYAESCGLVDKYQSLLESIQSIDDGTTIGELVYLLGDFHKLIIVAGDNSSGIDVIDLTNGEIDEWTW